MHQILRKQHLWHEQIWHILQQQPSIVIAYANARTMRRGLHSEQAVKQAWAQEQVKSPQACKKLIFFLLTSYRIIIVHDYNKKKELSSPNSLKSTAVNTLRNSNKYRTTKTNYPCCLLPFHGYASVASFANASLRLRLPCELRNKATWCATQGSFKHCTELQ